MAAAAAARSYLDFEPTHNVVQDTNKQTLVINLPGFKKEHLRVQIDHYGKLRISGERQLEQGSSKWSRFRKEFHIPEGCDPTGVRARFEKDGVLHITMPRLSPVEEPKMPNPMAAADAAATGQGQSAAAAHGAAPAQPAAAAEEKKQHEEEAARMRPGEEDEHMTSGDEGGIAEAAAARRRPGYGFVRDRSGMVRRLLLAVALVVVGVAGLYARYRLMGPSAEPSPADDTAVVGLSDY